MQQHQINFKEMKYIAPQCIGIIKNEMTNYSLYPHYTYTNSTSLLV